MRGTFDLNNPQPIGAAGVSVTGPPGCSGAEKSAKQEAEDSATNQFTPEPGRVAVRRSGTLRKISHQARASARPGARSAGLLPSRLLGRRCCWGRVSAAGFRGAGLTGRAEARSSAGPVSGVFERGARGGSWGRGSRRGSPGLSCQEGLGWGGRQARECGRGRARAFGREAAPPRQRSTALPPGGQAASAAAAASWGRATPTSRGARCSSGLLRADLPRGAQEEAPRLLSQ